MSIDQHELVSATHVTHTSSDAHHVHTSLAASPQNMFGGKGSLPEHLGRDGFSIQLVQILN